MNTITNPIIGRRIGKLRITHIHSAIPRSGTSNRKTARLRYVYGAVCDCGNTTTIRDTKLYGAKTKRSCGMCVYTPVDPHRFRTPDPETLTALHAKIAQMRYSPSRHKLYGVWCGILSRCTSDPNYAGRGITVCDAWRNDFWSFALSAGKRPAGMSIDRIDNDGPYSPENCRWATPVQQANNRRTTHMCVADGRLQSIHDWALELGVPVKTLKAAASLVPFDVVYAHAKKRK